MQLNEISFSDGLPIDGYGPGFFRIGGKVRKGAQLVLPSGVADWGGFGDISAIVAGADSIDVLFVGTGSETAHLPPEFRAALEEAGVGAEPMASPVACRTYNILLSEGRRVGVALIPV